MLEKRLDAEKLIKGITYRVISMYEVDHKAMARIAEAAAEGEDAVREVVDEELERVFSSVMDTLGGTPQKDVGVGMVISSLLYGIDFDVIVKELISIARGNPMSKSIWDFLEEDVA